MGCYNCSCVISGIPIYNGMEVEVFLLKKRKQYFGEIGSYSVNRYLPLIYSFYGKYNDYGAIENPYGICFDQIMDFLKNNIDFSDTNFSKDLFNILNIFELGNWGDLKLKTGEIIVPVMACKTIVDQILQLNEKNYYNNDYIQTNFNFYTSDIKEFIQDIYCFKENIFKNNILDSLSFDLFGVQSYFNCNYKKFKCMNFLNSFDSLEDNIDGRTIRLDKVFFKSILINDKIEILKEIMKIEYLNVFMNKIGKYWIPPMTQGQDTVDSFDKLNFISKLIKKEEKKFKQKL